MLTKHWFLLVLACYFVGLFSACTKSEDKGKLLAQVGAKSLFAEDLAGVVAPGASVEDSLTTLKVFVERWVRDAVLMDEAEKSVPSDLNLDKLVEDYRSSLVKHHYENVLVSSLIDSMVTSEELFDYYEKNKEQYRLSVPIMKVSLLKISLDHNELKQVEKWMERGKTEDMLELAKFAATDASFSIIGDTTWYKQDELSSILPSNVLGGGTPSSNRLYRGSDSEYQYYCKIEKVIDKGEIPPLSAISDQAQKVILNRRKVQILQVKREDMYERELRRNNVKFFLETN